MMVWKMIFLFNWVIVRFHVNLPGCRMDDLGTTPKFLETAILRFKQFKQNNFFETLFFWGIELSLSLSCTRTMFKKNSAKVDRNPWDDWMAHFRGCRKTTSLEGVFP